MGCAMPHYILVFHFMTSRFNFSNNALMINSSYSKLWGMKKKKISIISFIIPLNFNASRSSTSNTPIFMSRRWQKNSQGKLQSEREIHSKMGERVPSTRISDICLTSYAAHLGVFKPRQTSDPFLKLHPFVL